MFQVDDNEVAEKILEMEDNFAASLKGLTFGDKVAHVYNPLEYAAEPHKNFVKKYLNCSKAVLFLGMNPGPFGMAQNGVPFGDTGFVKNWLGVFGEVTHPVVEHPKRVIKGLNCTRKEVSGTRFWGLAQKTCGNAEKFFKNCFVANFCPLLFLSHTGSNIIPSKLPLAKRRMLEEICSEYLLQYIQFLNCKIIVAVGKYAEEQVRKTLLQANLMHINVAYLLHPSPASPQANRGWEEVAIQQLHDCGVLQILQAN